MQDKIPEALGINEQGEGNWTLSTTNIHWFRGKTIPPSIEKMDIPLQCEKPGKVKNWYVRDRRNIQCGWSVLFSNLQDVTRIHFNVHSGHKYPTVQFQIEYQSSCTTQSRGYSSTNSLQTWTFVFYFYLILWLLIHPIYKNLKCYGNILMFIPFYYIKTISFFKITENIVSHVFSLSGINVFRINITNEYSTKNKQISFTFKVTVRGVFQLTMDK